MRISTFLGPLLAVPLVLAGTAASDLEPTFLWASCGEATYIASRAPLTPVEPAAFGDIAPCGWVAAPVDADQPSPNFYYTDLITWELEPGDVDAYVFTWSTKFDGPIETLELRTHLAAGSAAHGQIIGQAQTNSMPIQIEVDGEVVFEGRVEDLGQLSADYALTQFDWFVDLAEAAIGEGEHDVAISFGHPSSGPSPIGASGYVLWGTADFAPGGVLFNGGVAS